MGHFIIIIAANNKTLGGFFDRKENKNVFVAVIMNISRSAHVGAASTSLQ